MNRKDREVKDVNDSVSILKRCNTIRLGLMNQDNPYVVPVSFGLDVVDNKIIIYFHSALVGLKNDCITKNNHVCIEADIFYKVETTKTGITARYESVIGIGSVSKVEGEEKIYGLSKLVEHYGFSGYPIERCLSLSNTAVYKIVLFELTGKRNLPAD
ncbi:MAG: pyridoxamine 5'-phosphate oxidase family protein [Anaeroplasmataceae bacterium]|nr:pyridoxamine 5'-phosphate oxidase family protein [Anaeroplasmataceae bacterium]MDE6414607.1 pyridoxamine 5'-phosphate oxidase family protein [Anaeroplasmataceae bacterium]